MNPTVNALLACAACLSSAAAAYLVVRLRQAAIQRARRREAAFGSDVARARRIASANAAWPWAMRYAEALTRRLFTGRTYPITPSVRAKRADKTRSGMFFAKHAKLAGCSKDISLSAFCEARTRLAGAGLALGALIGSLLSAELAVLLGLGGLALGRSLPTRAIRATQRERGICAERHLSEMLEVVALGLRSGLTFDRSFELYGSHFQNDFAESCAKAHRRWALGLAGRDEALHDLADSYDCAQLSRVVDSVIRSLRFGSSCTEFLEEAAAQSRATYRTALEERVAKAPVKMMVPTGTLILPAMLLLVMGPILLELASGF